MRPIVALALSVLVSACALRPSIVYQGGSLSKVGAVVFIQSEKIHPFTKQSYTGNCTGFYVAPTVVMTAAHCVNPQATFLVREDITTALEPIHIDVGMDLAILRSSRRSQVYLVMDPGPFSFDDDVWVYSHGDPNPQYMLVIRTTIGNPAIPDGGGVLLTHMLVQGQSGSPIVSQSGQLVSVAVRSSQAFGYGASVKSVEEMMQRARLE